MEGTIFHDTIEYLVSVTDWWNVLTRDIGIRFIERDPII